MLHLQPPNAAKLQFSKRTKRAVAHNNSTMLTAQAYILRQGMSGSDAGSELPCCSPECLHEVALEPAQVIAAFTPLGLLGI